MSSEVSDSPGEGSGASRDITIVGVGASAGGLEAIREMLSPARRGAPFAYVVVQHLDPNHESMLAELLSRHTELEVQQVSGGEEVLSGHVYIIPPGRGLRLAEGRLELTDFNQPRGLRRPIDDFFESLAVDCRERAVCVILSGTGADGSSGLRAIKEHGGICIAQDASARYDGMPTSAVATGLVDLVCASADIFGELVRLRSGENRQGGGGSVLDLVGELCRMLRTRLGHDFSGYKRSTLARRVERRMQVLGVTDGRAYLERVEQDSEECETLFRDFLINVTRFFRDPANYDVLRRRAVQPLVEEAEDGAELRIWVPGASSGEEAYSIAMLFAREIKLHDKDVGFQIFATDIDEAMLEIAWAGIYPSAALADIPEEFRDGYTVGRDASFQIAPTIRDAIRFSVHSVIKDPPFSRLDLISCRNLLIYFDDKLQAATLPVFHYALNRGGYLFLGPSENVSRTEDRFAPVDQKARLFRRDRAPSTYPIDMPGAMVGRSRRWGTRRTPARSEEETRPNLAAQRVLDRYAPTTLQVTRQGQILSSTGQLARYLTLDPAAAAPLFAQSVAKPGLSETVSALLWKASSEKRRTIARGLSVLSEFGTQPVDVIVEPLGDDTLLLIFHETSPFVLRSDEEMDELNAPESHVLALEDELRLTRAQLRATVEELETANEELKSSNEEMMSMNEELQSTNEELTTVNDELKSKVDLLSDANTELRNFFLSTELPLLTVDRDLRIRTFTEATRAVYPLQNGDRGRPLQDMQSLVLAPDEIVAAAQAVVSSGEAQAMTLTGVDGRKSWHLQITAYRKLDRSVDGATLVFSDITELRRLEQALQREGERLRLALDVSGIGTWDYDTGGGFVDVDDNSRALFGLDETGRVAVERILEAIHPQDREGVREAFRNSTEADADYAVSFRVQRQSGALRYLSGAGRRIAGSDPVHLVGVNLDMTAEHEARAVRDLMLREMNHRMKNLFSIVAGMLRMASRKLDTSRELADEIIDRITALARSYDLTQMTPAGREEATLGMLVEASLAPYLAEVTVEGPELRIPDRQVTSLAMTFHEWATNAAKYGVLGPVQGRLDIRWEVDARGRVTVLWSERYDTPVEAAERHDGFGSTLVQMSAMQLGGEIDVEVSEMHRTNRLRFNLLPKT